MKTLHRVFDNRTSATIAMRQLVDAGVPRDNLSIVGPIQRSNHAFGFAMIGLATGAVIGILTSAGVIQAPEFDPLVRAGVLLPIAAAAVVGMLIGAVIGGLDDSGEPPALSAGAHPYADALRSGASLVIVRTPDHMSDLAATVLGIRSTLLERTSAPRQRAA